MIIESVLNLLKNIIFTVFGLLPNIPDIPEISESFETVFSMVLDYAATLISIFIRPATIYIVLPVVLIVVNFEHIYQLVLFILKKIPFIGIE